LPRIGSVGRNSGVRALHLVAPIDGKEYVTHRGGANARHAGSETKKGRDRTERSSKARII
jgi:hypothetical protein